MATKKQPEPQVTTEIVQEDPATNPPTEVGREALLREINSLKSELQALKTPEALGLKMVSVKLGRKFDLGNYNSLSAEVSLWYDLAPGENPDEAFEYLWTTCRNEIRNVAEPILQKARAVNGKPPATTQTTRSFMGDPVEE